MSLECNGGHIALKKSWAKYFLGKMNFVKQKATTKSKLIVKNFEEVRYQFLLDIKAVAEMAEIPYDLIINWDQTGIKYIPVSEWMMEKEGSKKVEIAGINDKRQITAVFAGSLTGDFLPVQLVYKGTTTKCLPSVSFHRNGTSQQHTTTRVQRGYNGGIYQQDHFSLFTRKEGNFEIPTNLPFTGYLRWIQWSSYR